MFTKRGSSSSAFGDNLYLARVLKTTLQSSGKFEARLQDTKIPKTPKIL